MMRQLHQLSEHDIHSVVTALRSGRISLPFSVTSLSRFVPSSIATGIADELQQLANIGFAPAQIATTLELLIDDRKHRPLPEESIDLVTSGPEASTVSNRDTAVVVRDLFASAKESVLIAGYAIYQGQRVFQALAERMEAIPSLEVRMFLDIQRGRADTTESSVLVYRFADRLKKQQWPVGHRLPKVFYDPRSLEIDKEKSTSLHAKAIVVDQRTVFVSSANFTEAAQHRNIEVGLLINSETLARKLTDHFEKLLAEHCLLAVPITDEFAKS